MIHGAQLAEAELFIHVKSHLRGLQNACLVAKTAREEQRLQSDRGAQAHPASFCQRGNVVDPGNSTAQEERGG